MGLRREELALSLEYIKAITAAAKVAKDTLAHEQATTRDKGLAELIYGLTMLKAPDGLPAMPCDLVRKASDLVCFGLMDIGVDLEGLINELFARIAVDFRPDTNARTRKEIEDEIAEREELERRAHQGLTHPSVQAGDVPF